MTQVEICSDCGSPFVVDRRVVHSLSQSQEVIFPLYCSNPKCQNHDPANKHMGWSVTREE